MGREARKFILLISALAAGFSAEALNGSARRAVKRATGRFAQPGALAGLERPDAPNPCRFNADHAVAEGAFLEGQWNILRFQALHAEAKQGTPPLDARVERGLARARRSLEGIYAHDTPQMPPRELALYLSAVNDVQAQLSGVYAQTSGARYAGAVRAQRRAAYLELLGGLAGVCERLSARTSGNAPVDEATHAGAP